MTIRIIFKIIPFLIGLLLISSCAQIPKNAQVVENFQYERYLGIWHEIARTENSFEKDMDNISAHYSLKENGNINVFNTGSNFEKQKWTSVNGKAKFRDDKTTAA